MGKYQVLLDNMYKCELCKYYTCNKRDFDRHLKTKRHLNLKAKCEEESSAHLFKQRIHATDENDDFTVIPETLISPEDIYDSQDDKKIKNKKNKFNKKKKNEEFFQTNLKKTNSGENIVITHVELDDIVNPLSKDDKVIDKEGGRNESIYESIYTNPFIIIQFLSDSWKFCKSFKNNIFKFTKEMFTSVGTPQLSHDKI
jgi:hypothetical protein